MVESIVERSEAQLAAYAVTQQRSRGRVYEESPPATRTEFQRDRDRIIHSTAFRRLEYKTQVFVNHEGDLYRTRLTHSLEVGQIARSIARALAVNEDLVEAIALAHDLGHTPFGHAGQDALNQCMADYGGFEHNLQSLRVVEVLEQRYSGFDGLNLIFETREGILKRCPPETVDKLGEVARRFREGSHPVAEAQIANIADEIAYNNHDIDDGLRSGLINMDQLQERVPLFREEYAAVRRRHPEVDRERRWIYETIRRLIDRQVTNLIDTTRHRLETLKCDSPEAVRAAEQPVAAFSPPMEAANRELKEFLHSALYRHYRVVRMAVKGGQIIRSLYSTFMDDPMILPPEAQNWAQQLETEQGQAGRATAVADYIAGMTDRYAIGEYQRIFDPYQRP